MDPIISCSICCHPRAELNKAFEVLQVHFRKIRPFRNSNQIWSFVEKNNHQPPYVNVAANSTRPICLLVACVNSPPYLHFKTAKFRNRANLPPSVYWLVWCSPRLIYICHARTGMSLHKQTCWNPVFRFRFSKLDNYPRTWECVAQPRWFEIASAAN